MIRAILCDWCRLPSVNQYGTSPFNHLGTLSTNPTVILHSICAWQVNSFLCQEFTESPSNPLVARFQGYADDR